MICPDKVSTEQWLAVHDAAHRVGLRSNVTIMFGHVERPEHWARHLLRAREQQQRSGGFTEFVPLPFVHMEAPMWLQGRARSGPTFGESLLLHAVARLALHPAITNIQVSWVKLGPEGVAAALRAGVTELPELHIHAFSALEVWQGAETLGLPLEEYLERLRSLGLGSLPGTAAEILDDEVRAVICPDKVSTEQWLSVHDAAHRVGLRSNVTIMFGHVERPEHWARHLLRAREQQQRSGGFTEFVPLPFVHMEAPMWLQGRARSGPTFGESLLLHAVARLALHPAITNIQASWVKLGPQGVAAALRAGRQRPRRHADERVDLALRRLRARAGDAARGDGGADPRERTHAAAADDALRRRAGGAPGRLVRRSAAGRAAEPAGPRRRPEGAAAPRPARACSPARASSPRGPLAAARAASAGSARRPVLSALSSAAGW